MCSALCPLPRTSSSPLLFTLCLCLLRIQRQSPFLRKSFLKTPGEARYCSTEIPNGGATPLGPYLSLVLSDSVDLSAQTTMQQLNPASGQAEDGVGSRKGTKLDLTYRKSIRSSIETERLGVKGRGGPGRKLIVGVW